MALRRIGALSILSLTLAPSVGLAWPGDPLLCSVPELMSDMRGRGDFGDEAEHAGVGMCDLPRQSVLPQLGGELCTPMSRREIVEDAPQVARSALFRARELMARGLHEDALLNFRVVEALLPRVADHVAVMRAELHERQGDFARAASAYREAVELGQTLDLVAQAQVAYVRTLFLAGDASADRALEELMKRYPSLPEGADLSFEQARYREAKGQTRLAAATYRQLDLTLPGYPVGKKARERLSALSGQGVSLVPLSEPEMFARAERLLKSGPIELARDAVSEIAAHPLPKTLHLERDNLVASLASQEVRLGTAEPALTALGGFASHPEREALERRIRLQLIDKKKLAKQRPAFLLQWLAPACELRLTDVADELLRELTRRAAAVPADLRFNAIALASGTANDAELVALASTLISHPSLGLAARYHRARALERLGRFDEAKADHKRVAADDTNALRFYGGWADQRLRSFDAAPGACAKAGLRADCNRSRVDVALSALDRQVERDLASAIAYLTPVAAQHSVGYPWLARALDLLRLGEVDAAADELHETYVAFRFVTKRGAFRAGREAIYRSASVMVPTADANVRKLRLSLGQEARSELAKTASVLGDFGTAGLFGGPSWAETNPVPYASEVARVARKYNVDPDLLYAVMRVESVYQRRIISHAGAIGLMQIMPRTGRLIADKLGREDSTTTDLLDARTNLEYSAWYLASLIERMDGRLPLAIASYNGGPHNVRRWIRTYGAHVPLDAFLERIPFTETKRYVRRVLGYYARYKAQRGDKIDLLSVTLPPEVASDVAF